MDMKRSLVSRKSVRNLFRPRSKSFSNVVPPTRAKFTQLDHQVRSVMSNSTWVRGQTIMLCRSLQIHSNGKPDSQFAMAGGDIKRIHQTNIELIFDKISS